MKNLSMLRAAMCAALLSACAGPGLHAQTKPLFTEDFESGDLNKAVWTPLILGDATVKVQQDQVAHGKSALAVHYPGMAARSYAFIANTHLPEALRQHHFGRAYVMLPAQMPQQHTVLLLSGTSGFPMANFLEVGYYRGTVQPSFQQNAENGPNRGETPHHGQAFPQGKWFCLEWEFNDDPDQIVLWVDGEKVHDSVFEFRQSGHSNLVKAFTDAVFGVRVWGAVAETFDVYYDDIAIDTKRIGPIK